MYKAAFAAITMTAAALLLAAAPALAGDDLDFHGPSFIMCEDGMTNVIKMDAPMTVWTTTAGCADTDDDDSHGHGMN
ncbi:hypothetical protein [Nonomuraea gerenzanensis]|uniref:Secreted protein n=1 Tax=Nonomuraea gerenzanensis TaxID=93944 RepID=A0A1M4EJY4_9ACTN|nr:hypothetical protein [Nonomuraea gerenzanensis]UBU10760.1 hypothetical protein LCN96_41525 [Nonomuraea gerenzanensis]SBO99189.1 hypothetical protein BN4615_P8705 [Nonomuraea gerenzanensis]